MRFERNLTPRRRKETGGFSAAIFGIRPDSASSVIELIFGTEVDLYGRVSGMRAGFKSRVSRRVRVFRVSGSGPCGPDGSGQCGEGPEPGENLGEQVAAGREPQGPLPGVADQPAGDGDEPPPQGFDHGFAAADPVTGQDGLPEVAAVSWCSHAAMFEASSAPHIQAVLTWMYPDGRWRRAAPCLLSRKTFSMVVRCRYQCPAAAALSGADTSRFVRMNEQAQIA